MEAPSKITIWAKSTPALLKTAGRFLMVPGIDSPSTFSFISKKPFQPIMCVVKKNCLTFSNKGISKVERMVNTIITLMVATIGPKEFSAKMEKKKPTAATVIKAKAE